jgi:hypothetical protein
VSSSETIRKTDIDGAREFSSFLSTNDHLGDQGARRAFKLTFLYIFLCSALLQKFGGDLKKDNFCQLEVVWESGARNLLSR